MVLRNKQKISTQEVRITQPKDLATETELKT